VNALQQVGPEKWKEGEERNGKGREVGRGRNEESERQ